MQILNYIYFLVITFYGIKFLYSSGVAVKHPLDRNQQMLLDGPEMFWVLTFSTGLLAFSAEGIGVDLMALRLFVLEILCFLGLFIVRNRPVWSVAIWLYAIYLVWIVIGCTFSPSPTFGLRVVLKYLYIFLLMLFASATIRDGEVLIKAGYGAVFIALIAIACSFIPPLRYIASGVFWYPTAKAIHFISLSIFSLTLYIHGGKEKKYLWLCLIFIAPCFIWVFRTSIVGTAIALTFFYGFRYKLKSLPLVFVIIIAFILSIFFIPSVREKMFFNEKGKNVEAFQRGKISMDDVNSNGRFAMWEWSLKKFYSKKEMKGTGTGNLQAVFYSLKHPFGGIRICHNDYVQILCDNGLIGLLLFAGSFLALILHCFIVYQDQHYGDVIHICAITAGASAAGVLFTMYTDNAINYTMATLSMPCGFYGMMLGLLQRAKEIG